MRGLECRHLARFASVAGHNDARLVATFNACMPVRGSITDANIASWQGPPARRCAKPV